jgi:hypothetical protein
MGKWLVEYLLKTGQHTITALTRPDSTSKIAEGVLIAHVDYDDPGSLTSALKGQDCLIITMSYRAPPDAQRRFISAAAAAGVPWVLPNEWGGDGNEAIVRDIPIALAKNRDRDYIGLLGVSSWIGIACSFWYEFSLAGGENRYGFDLKKREVTFYGDGKVLLNTSTWDQVSRAVAKLLSLPVEKEGGYEGPVVADWKNKFLCVSSFTISQRDMLDSLNRVMGTTDKDWTFKYEGARGRFQNARDGVEKGDRRAYVRMLYSRMFFPGETLNYEKRLGLANETLGLPKEDLDEQTKVAVKMDEDGYFSEKTGRF